MTSTRPQVVYWSSTGITKRVAERFNGVPLEQYQGGDYVLVVPSYGAPRTGNYVPTAVKKFLGETGDCLVGVIGVGNTNFGSDFCLGAVRIAERWGVPLIAKVDLVPSVEDEEAITTFLEGGR